MLQVWRLGSDGGWQYVGTATDMPAFAAMMQAEEKLGLSSRWHVRPTP